jgi:DNA replication protein DnaC
MHSEPATLNALLKRLGLSSVQKLLPEMVVLAEQEGWSYGVFLERLLAEAVAHRTDSRTAGLISRAKFPFAATIETFDFTFRSDLKRQMLGRFLGPELVSDNRSLILQGPPGTGKTHLAISIAYKAIQNGFGARFTTAAALPNDLRAAPDLHKALQSYLAPHVLVIDEIGYLGYGPDAADLLFQVVNGRYQKGRPILFTTNKALRQWGRVLHDEELARAILDRTLYYGEHLQFSGPSYRLEGRKLEWEDSATPLNK